MYVVKYLHMNAIHTGERTQTLIYPSRHSQGDRTFCDGRNRKPVAQQPIRQSYDRDGSLEFQLNEYGSCHRRPEGLLMEGQKVCS